MNQTTACQNRGPKYDKNNYKNEKHKYTGLVCTFEPVTMMTDIF